MFEISRYYIRPSNSGGSNIFSLKLICPPQMALLQGNKLITLQLVMIKHLIFITHSKLCVLETNKSETSLQNETFLVVSYFSQKYPFLSFEIVLSQIQIDTTQCLTSVVQLVGFESHFLWKNE